MTITRGTTFGVTEQITNTKLHNLIDTATLSIGGTEFATNALTSLPSTAGVLRQHSLIQSVASGGVARADGAGGWYASAS